jgi:hypothetical protein
VLALAEPKVWAQERPAGLQAGPPDRACIAALGSAAKAARARSPGPDADDPKTHSPAAVFAPDGFDGSWTVGRSGAGEPEGFRLAGLEIVGDAASRGQAWVLVADLLSTPGSEIVPLGPIDRWGRRPAVVRVSDGVLNAELTARGLALTRPDDAPAVCLRWWLKLEERARRDGRGLWGRPEAAAVALPSDEPGRILSQEGRFVVVEGRVRGLGETKSRVYLNFGTVRGEDFAIVIQKRNLRRVEASGMRWTSWEGRRVRVRGTVVRTVGPAIEVESPDGIERLD